MKPFAEVQLLEQGREQAYDLQGNLITGTVDTFYTTGSRPEFGEEPGSFVGPLKHKEKFSMSFAVKQSTKMLPNSSSIYYFDFTDGRWQIPESAIPNIVGPFDKMSFRTAETYDPLTGLGVGPYTSGTFVSEDRIGFDCYGHPIASGSLHVRRNDPLKYTHSFPEVFTDYTTSKEFDLITGDFPKSMQRSDDYKADSDKVFTLPISDPFLVTKIVFEIPLAFGDGWFYDKTTTLMASGSYSSYDDTPVPPEEPEPEIPEIWRRAPSEQDMNGEGQVVSALEDLQPTRIYKFDLEPDPKVPEVPSYFIDEGGPAITVAVMCQKNFGTSSIRELVTHETITHKYDYLTYPNIEFTDYLSGSSTAVMEGNYPAGVGTHVLAIINGIRRINSDVVVVEPFEDGARRYFSGSVQIRSEVHLSNGLKNIYFSNPAGYHSSFTRAGLMIDISNFLSTKNIQLAETKIVGTNTFGRGMSGFLPSGGSIFGGEFATSQNVVRDGKIRNPFYCTPPDDGDPDRKDDVLDAANTATFNAKNDPYGRQWFQKLAAVYTSSKKVSPYLVRPGDKLVLSLSKTRPAIHKYSVQTSWTDLLDPENPSVGKQYLVSSSYYNPVPDGHDVTLMTGSINVTFYGSYVRNGKEYVL